MKIIEYSVSKAMSKSGMMELDYAVNPYSGCLHRCLYCYAIDYTHQRDAASNWGDVVYVKTNIAHVLRREIIGMRRGIVGLGTVTDPYQSIEAKYRLSREVLEILLKNGFRVTVQTKSPIVTRDIDIFSLYKKTVDVGVTITTIEHKKSLQVETRTPSPSSRISALRRLSDAGIRTWIFLGPIIRGFNDDSDNLERIFQVAHDTRSRIIYDFFVGYAGASSLMRQNLPWYNDSKESNESLRWKSGIVQEIERLSTKYDIETNSQKDEWLVERDYNFGKLF
jgi:DNA repair photolyase